MNHFEKRESGEEAYKGNLLHIVKDVVRLENGASAVREVVRHPGAVCIGAVTEKNEIYLVRQFRYPFGRELLELPAGKLEPGEEPLSAAKRELGEEAGVLAQEYCSLGEYYPAAAYSDEVIFCFGAKGLSPCQMNLDEDEFLTPIKLPMDQAVRMAEEGEICDGKTCVAILRLQALRKKGAF